jgi:hypothetical protein
MPTYRLADGTIYCPQTPSGIAHAERVAERIDGGPRSTDARAANHVAELAEIKGRILRGTDVWVDVVSVPNPADFGV